MACRFQRLRLRHLLRNRRYLRRLLVCVSCQLLAILVFCRVMDGRALVVYLAFGGALVPRTGSMPSVMSILTALLPQTVAVLSLADAVRLSLEMTGPLTLPRTGSRSRWAVRRIMAAGSAAVVTIMLYMVETMAAAALLSGREVARLIPAVLLAALLQVLTLVLLVLTANVLSLMIDPLLAGVSVAAVHVATLLAAAFTSVRRPILLLTILPSIQGVFAWHDLSAFGIPNIGLLGFPLGFSLAYLLLSVVAAAGVLVRIVSKIDIL